MYPENDTMQEGQPRTTLKKDHNARMFVEALLVRPPGLKRAAGNLKRLGRLTQGEPLGLQSEILIEEVLGAGASPSWGAIIMAVAIIMALWMGLDDGSHSDLLLNP